MAAIVSQLAAANRRRKANKKNNIPIEKSVYVLPPFDPCFKAEVHNRYIRHKQAHLAHQEFIARIGTVSPVHIHQLEQMGTQRMKTKRAGPPLPAETAASLATSPPTSPLRDDPPVRPLVPKRGEGVHSNKKQLLQEDPQIELRLLDEETLEAPASCDNQSQSPQPSPETDLKCQLVIAFLGLLALVPLVGIVIYLVGMFYGVPPTTNFESSSIQADQETTTKDQTMTTTIVY